MPKFVGTDLEFRDVRLEYRVSRHVPVHTGIALAAFFPCDDFRGSDVLDEV